MGSSAGGFEVHFTFSKISDKDSYEIRYELFNDKIQSVKKNDKEITDPTERELIFQSLINEIKMPTPDDIEKAKESQFLTRFIKILNNAISGL